jgi:PAS domain S-box-containing protein
VETSPGKARILVVDDHPANLIALEAVLAPLGHAVVSAHSGEEAIALLRGPDVAVVLLDMCMPGIDGLETAARIKAHPRTRRLPIIFLTAADMEPQMLSRAYAQGAVDFLQKPFDPTVLRSKVSVFVELYLQAEEIRRQSALLRKRARERFEAEAATRVHALTDLMPLCVWAAGRDGRIHYCNKAWVAYTGLSVERANQLDHLQVIHAEDRGRVVRAWRNAVETGEPLVVEYRLRRAEDGVYRWHLGRAVPELDRRGRIIGWLATATDIDDQKHAEERHAEANRMKDQFLATVSHELRTPLNAIFGWIRMLRSGQLDTRSVPKALETIERNTKIQAQLVEDLLDVSRIVSGKLRLDVTPLTPADVVRNAVDAVRLTAEAKGVQLNPIIDPTPCRVMGDASRLQQVVWNLVQNAIKFTPSGGRIDVMVGSNGEQVEIEVSDTGHGIAPEFLPFVFDRFRQADGSSTRAHGGLGLGLAIVRHIVELHAGTVDVESPGYGQGARFTVRLPVDVSQAPAGDLPPIRESGSFDAVPELTGLRLLVVDDDPDARDLLTLVLEQYGAHVVAVDCAPDALRQLDNGRLDVLLSDIGMPGQNGYELIREVRAREALAGGFLPAVALTGYASPEDGQRALAAGFQMHLPKPIDPAELLSLVGRLAGRMRPANAIQRVQN